MYQIKRRESVNKNRSLSVLQEIHRQVLSYPRLELACFGLTIIVWSGPLSRQNRWDYSLKLYIGKSMVIDPILWQVLGIRAMLFHTAEVRTIIDQIFRGIYAAELYRKDDNRPWEIH